MFERFTDRARRVVVLAQEEAHKYGASEIRTDHILLALIVEGEGVACKALEALGYTYDNLMGENAAAWGLHSYGSSGHIPYSLNAKRALEVSLREALQLGHNYIGTEHILLGLLKGTNNASEALDGPKVRQQVIQLLSGYQDKAKAPERDRLVFTTFKGSKDVILEEGTYEDVVSAIEDDLASGKLSFTPEPLVFEVEVLRFASFEMQITVNES